MKVLKRIYMIMIFAFLYAPIAVLIFYSFNESKSRAVFTGFTLKWYVEMFRDSQIMSAVSNTLIIALISSVIGTVIGTAAAIGIHYMKKNPKQLVLNITNIPILNPDIVTGVSLMIVFVTVFNFLGIGRLGLATVLLAHITFNIPYVIFSILPKLRQMDPNLLEAAMDLGATPIYAIIKVIIPEIMPGIISGLMLCFTLSVDDFVISYFTTGSGVSNISILINSMTRQGINPKINALSTLMFITVLGLLILVNALDRKSSFGSKEGNKGANLVP